MRRLLLAGWFILLPNIAAAQTPATPPESFLAENSTLYFRFDGIEPHRAAFDRTVIGELMHGELGAFMEYVGQVITQQMNKTVMAELPKAGIVPAHLLQIQNAYGHLPQLLDYCNRHGFLVGVELIDLENYRTQLTLVFPHGGERKSKHALFAFFNLIPSLAEMKVAETKVGTRTIYLVEGTAPVTVAWWQEGEHVIATVGTEPPEHTLMRVDGKSKNLTSNPLFQSVAKFDRYETMLRGFLDFEPGLKMAKTKFPPANRLIEQLGLDGLKDLTFWSGCEGRAQRSTMVLRTAKDRKGLLRAFTGASSLEFDRLPAIPPDATSVSAMDVDLAALADIILEAVQAVVREVAPDQADSIQQGVKQAEQMLGFDPRKDLLGSLGSQIVTYTTPSEGPFWLGSTCMIKVRDAKKLEATIEKLVAFASQAADNRITITTRDCHGVTLRMVQVKQPGMFLVPTYAIYQDWLVLSLMPQGVQGFALRAAGKVPAWKPTLMAGNAIAAEAGKGKITGFSITDPRPTATTLMSFAPIVGGFVNSVAPGGFDVSMIPNAQSVVGPLFPNIGLTIDEGDAIRSESWESLALPDLGGVAWMAVGSLAAIGNLGRSAQSTFNQVGNQINPPPPVPQLIPPKKPKD